MMTAKIAQAKQQSSEWVQAHEALSRLAKQRAAADAEEGRCLLRALRSATHLHLGFGSFVEYVERLFGYKPRSTQEKLRVAETLERLPTLAAALESGALAWSAVRELTRVARAENEREWLDLALGKTLRQVEGLVEGKSPGDDPSASSPPAERRHVLRFEVAAETFALFREAIVHLRRRTDSMLDDDSALLLMARHVLGGPVDAGRANYQIALTVCAHCGAGHQHAAGELVVVGAEVIERARCDGQHVGRVDVPAANENAGVGGVGLLRASRAMTTPRPTGGSTPTWAARAWARLVLAPTWALKISGVTALRNQEPPHTLAPPRKPMTRPPLLAPNKRSHPRCAAPSFAEITNAARLPAARTPPSSTSITSTCAPREARTPPTIY